VFLARPEVGSPTAVTARRDVEGFEQLPTAINMLFDGKNIGKLVVKVRDDGA
jgi:NADPH-dependent curcumin reductase CurA